VNQFGFFAKYWTPGQVKTRLAASIGHEAAANLYRCFIEVIAARFTDLAIGPQPYHLELAIAPSNKQAEFAEIIPENWSISPQIGADLGAKMKNYFDTAFTKGAETAILIGSDSPNLPRKYVEQAFEALTKNDVVLGPAEDQGYYLVGARRQTPAIFHDIDWSTEQVWPQTIQRLENASLRYETLPVWFDIDLHSDLLRLKNDLDASREDWEQALLAAVNAALRSVAE